MDPTATTSTHTNATQHGEESGKEPVKPAADPVEDKSGNEAQVGGQPDDCVLLNVQGPDWINKYGLVYDPMN